jgi:hypothetical protein
MPSSAHPPAQGPSALPSAGQTLTYTVSPRAPVNQTIPEATSVTNVGTDGIRAEATRAANHLLYLQWQLPPETTLPPGSRVVDVHTVVCGSGTGDFWEIYGPYGALEIEYEVTDPSADGCWHFTQDPGTNYRVEIYVDGNSAMTITKIEFRVTFA